MTAVNYTWDNANRLTNVTQGSSSVGLVYDSANRRTTLMLPNGVTVAYPYDTESHLAGLTYAMNGTQLASSLNPWAIGRGLVGGMAAGALGGLTAGALDADIAGSAITGLVKFPYASVGAPLGAAVRDGSPSCGCQR